MLSSKAMWELSRHPLNYPVGSDCIYYDTKITGASCTMYEKDGIYYVVFTGTELKCNDILTDILFCKSIVPYDGTDKKIKVHLGFLTQYFSLRMSLLAKIRSIPNAKCFVFIGHSLGAALATLATLDFQYNLIGDCVCGVGFGSPRVGNKYFADSFNKRVGSVFLNYFMNDDIVTKVPFKWMGFEHVGTQVTFGYSKKLFSFKSHFAYGEYLI